jgi:iron complex outermembrane receptor protein
MWRYCSHRSPNDDQRKEKVMRKVRAAVLVSALQAGAILPGAAQSADTPQSLQSDGQSAPEEMPQAPQPIEQDLATIPVAVPSEQAAALQRESGQDGGIEEVLVTARRVSESLQEVPIAISALSSADLEREQVNSAQDLQGKVPSLVISSNSQMRNTETPSIRGQGAQFGAPPGVIVYFAEVPLPADLVANNQGGPGKFFDLQNLQILKGSQGTLFGRNTTGGALLLEPHRPDEFFSGSLKAEATSFDGTGYEGVLNVPVVDETLLVRAGFKYFDRDGFTHDVANGTNYDNKHFKTGRLGLTWKPTEGIENYLLGYLTRSRDNGTGNVIEDINREGLNRGILGAIGLGAIPPIPDPLGVGPGCLLLDLTARSLNCGRNILDDQHARGHRDVELGADPTDRLDTGGVIDNFSVKLNDDMTVRNIASYSTFKHLYRWDLDGSRAAFVDYVNPDDKDQADVRTATEELQLQGTARDSKLKYVIGGYYEHTKAKGDSYANALFVEQVIVVYDQTKTSFAPFIQGTYDLGDLYDSLSGLNLTGGARYTFDSTTGHAHIVQKAANVLTTVDTEYDASVKSEALTYTAGLDYHLGASLLYGKVSRGYKTGGIAPTSVTPEHYTYKPEYVTNYEIGQKSDFELADMPVRLNTAVYFTDYSNLQKASVDTYDAPGAGLPQVGASVVNAGAAQLYGLEVEATIRPFTGATLVATYGYTHAEYTQFNLRVGGVTPQVDCTGNEISVGDTAELSCVPFQQTPKNNFSVSARYLLPLDASWGDIEGSATYSWNARQYTSTNTVPDAEPGSWLDSLGLLNASLSWSKILGSNFDAQIFGSNLTNEDYRISNSNQWTFTYFRSSIYGEPRVIGMTLGYRWGQ